MTQPLRFARTAAAARNLVDRILYPERLVNTGDTPYEVLADDGLIRLRHYRAAPVEGSRRVPLVIVPPLAVNMLIYDLLPERSFVRFITGLGIPVYLLDWGSPGVAHSHYTLSTYVKRFMPPLMARIREHAGTRVLSLQGWSMGGGLALAYTAYHRDTDIQNIVTVGTGVDGHANGLIGRRYRQLAGIMQRLDLSLRKLPARYAYSPGWLNVVGFKLSDPVGSWRGYRDLMVNLHDRDYVAQHATQAAFIDHLEAYPGGVIRDWGASVWIENETAKGRLTLGRECADFSSIRASVLAIAGRSDTLANVDCCRPLTTLVGSADTEFFIAPGGHTGIMSGSQAPGTSWSKIGAWLLERS